MKYGGGKMAGRKSIDFLQGNVTKQMLLFTLPLILGELLQTLYNSVDLLVVGNFVSDEAQAAISVGATIANLVISFFNGMSVGASVIVARAFGKGNRNELITTITTVFTFSAVLGLILSVIGMLLTPQLVALCTPPKDVFSEAVSYLRIYLAGLMFTVIYNIGAGILRAIGNSQTPFVILAATSLLNMVLDVLFVTAIPLGIVGVSTATVISQAISVLLIYWELYRFDKTIGISFREMRAQRKTVYEAANIGIPSGMQGALIAFSNLFMWRYIGMLRSTSAIAGIGIAQRLDHFAAIPPKAFGVTLTTFIGQNEGAGNHTRAKTGKYYNLTLSIVVTMSVGVFFYCFAPFLVKIFNQNPEIISVGISMMRTLMPFYFVMALREFFLSTLRGYGNAHIPMVLSLCGMVGFRQLYLFIAMNRRAELRVIYNCYPLAWAVTAALLGVYYFWWNRKHKAIHT